MGKDSFLLERHPHRKGLWRFHQVLVGAIIAGVIAPTCHDLLGVHHEWLMPVRQGQCLTEGWPWSQISFVRPAPLHEA